MYPQEPLVLLPLFSATDVSSLQIYSSGHLTPLLRLCQTDAKYRALGNAVSHTCFPIHPRNSPRRCLLHGLGLIMCTFGAAFFYLLFFFFFEVSLELVPGKIWM